MHALHEDTASAGIEIGKLNTRTGPAIETRCDEKGQSEVDTGSESKRNPSLNEVGLEYNPQHLCGHDVHELSGDDEWNPQEVHVCQGKDFERKLSLEYDTTHGETNDMGFHGYAITGGLVLEAVPDKQSVFRRVGTFELENSPVK